MQTYPIPMTPGPVSVPPEYLEKYLVNYGASDLEPEFLELYNQAEDALKTVMSTRNSVVIHTGEGMLALWSALKSCLLPGDRVLAVATGVFGYGIGDMARSIGAEVKTVGLPYDQTLGDLGEVEQAIRDFAPKMITVVHCETPSGTLNPIAGLGELKERLGVPLLYVDAVSSIGGAPVLTDEWHIDLCLGGSQKVLSIPPAMCFLSVSPRAWEFAGQVKYVGYDALLPFLTAQRDFYFPYTPYWHGMALLHTAARRILEEGLETAWARHAQAAAHCRQRLTELGIRLFPAPGAVPAPTVTAAYVPDQITWPELDRRLRARGLAVGGSYGPLTNQVFRLGHMGAQADIALIDRAVDAIAAVLEEAY